MSIDNWVESEMFGVQPTETPRSLPRSPNRETGKGATAPVTRPGTWVCPKGPDVGLGSRITYPEVCTDPNRATGAYGNLMGPEDGVAARCKRGPENPGKVTLS